MSFNSKIPGPSTDMRTVNMDFSYGSAFGEELPDAYERLLLDAMLGDSTLYMRKDEVDSAWAFITEILNGWSDSSRPDLSFYRAGSSGPDAATPLLGTAGKTLEAAVSTVLDPRSIEREIARIRERESNPYSSGVKTNLFTLVIFRKPGKREKDDPLAAALQYMLGRRPARIITIDRVDAPETGVVVSGRCFPDRRNRGVCFEEVQIESGEDGLGEDPGAWAPLLIRDLPVYAWWPDSLADSDFSWQKPILEAASLIDKLIVDSANTQDSGAPASVTMGGLLSLREKAGGSFFISDFAWRRGRVLRELTARAFDQPEMRLLLSAIRSVALDGGTRADSLLFSCWLSTRLGWAPLGGDDAAGAYRDRSGGRSASPIARWGPPCPTDFESASPSTRPRIWRSAARAGAASPTARNAARTSSRRTERSSLRKWTR